MFEYSLKDIQEAIDKVEDLYNKYVSETQYIMFAYSEEQKETLEKYFSKYFSNYDIRVLLQCCKLEENKDKVYVIPTSEYKPIKFIYED